MLDSLRIRVAQLARARRRDPTPENRKAWLKARMRLLRRAADLGVPAYTPVTMTLDEVQGFRAGESLLHLAAKAHVTSTGTYSAWMEAREELRRYSLEIVRRLVTHQEQETGE